MKVRLLARAALALALLAAAAAATACSSSAASSPAASVDDAGSPPGTGEPDGSPSIDGGADAPPTDAGGDAAGAGDILGTLSGTCGTLKALLTDPDPSLVDDTLAFVAGESYDRASLSPDGQRLYDTPNAGGSSTESEVMSFEVLHYCEGASLLKTETEIQYDNTPGSITDVLVSMYGKKVGVSVTRAYRPSSQPFGDSDVKALLEKKLNGINESSSRVLPGDKWVKQILHVFAATQGATDAITRVLPTIDPAVRADTIVLVTHTTGGGFIYCNPDPPLGSECP